MSEGLSQKERWRAVLQQQKLANAQCWLKSLRSAGDLNRFVLDEYDNLLRALELPVKDDETFEVANQIIQEIHPIISAQADWERWLVYLEKAVDWAHALGREIEEARLLMQISDIMIINANFDRADEYCQKSMELYKKLAQLDGYANSLLRTANIFLRQGKSSEAISSVNEAIKIAKNIGDPAIEAGALLTLSGYYLTIQDFSRSLEVGREAFSLSLDLKNEALASQALLTVMACLGELGEWGEAEEIASKLVSRYVEREDINNLTQLKNNIGILAFQKGEYLIAEAAWQESLRYHSQMQLPAQAAGVYNNLGMVYTKLEEWEEAVKMLNSALRIYDGLGDLFYWANAMDNLADLHEARGETAVCCQILHSALERTEHHLELPHLAALRQSMQERLKSLSCQDITP